jgi:predicted nucleic acid-binding protein
MHIFVDANILIAVINKELPYYDACARILSLKNFPKIEIFSSALSFGITAYFAEKKHGEKETRKRMELLMQNIKICNCGQPEVQQALENKKIGDLEDGVQYYAAKNSSCDYIVTYNQKDFFFSQLEVLLPEEMLGKCLHLIKNKKN